MPGITLTSDSDMKEFQLKDSLLQFMGFELTQTAKDDIDGFGGIYGPQTTDGIDRQGP